MEAAVEQECYHDEPPATRDEYALCLQADSDWASLVEWRIHHLAPSPKDGQSAEAAAAPSDVPEKVHVLRFGGGDGERLRRALLDGPEFGPVREALEKRGYPCVHSSKAVVLVKPHQYVDVDDALEAHDLHPFHIVISESLEYLLEEILAAIPCRRRPRQKVGSRKLVAAAVAVAAEQQTEDEVFVLCERRTFLCISPVLRPPGTVAQSTTEAVLSHGRRSRDGRGLRMWGPGFEAPRGYFTHFRGVNPRRVVAAGI